MRGLTSDPRAKSLPSDWTLPVSAWLGSLIAAGHTPPTIETRRQQISQAARHLPASPFAVDASDLAAYVAGRDWSRETRRSNYAAIRSFYHWAAAEGYVEVDPSLWLPSVKPMQPMPRPTPDDVYDRALAVSSKRTRLILRFAAEVGMRRTEISLVHRRDLIRDEYGWSLVVHGKGEKDRIVPLPDSLALEVQRCRGWLFPGDEDGHLSARWIGKLAVQVLPDGWTLHSLRHRFATRAYGDGDLIAVQQLLGHASVATTQRYVLPDQARVRQAAARASGLRPLHEVRLA